MPLDREGDLQRHSEAKVRLLSRYIIKYLAVVTNVPTFDEIDIYDLFCGNGQGSPSVIMKEVKNSFFSRQARSQQIY